MRKALISKVNLRDLFQQRGIEIMSFSGSSFFLNPVISEVSAYGCVLNERMMFFLSRALLCTHKRQFFAEFSHTHN